MVLWDTKDVVGLDMGGTSDIFLKVFFEEKVYRETDTHWRCGTGKGSFNWRALMDTTYPRHDDDYMMTVQCWDRDVLSANKLIGETALDLEEPMRDCMLTDHEIMVTKTYYESHWNEKLAPFKLKWHNEDSFWVPATAIDEKTGKVKVNGYVRMSLKILPKHMADISKLGHGRDAPNHDPFCPPPVGRISFTLNPFKMLL